MPVGLSVGAEDEESEEVRAKQSRTAVMALDVALLSFARWRSADPNPQWIISGSKVFRYHLHKILFIAICYCFFSLQSFCAFLGRTEQCTT